MRLFSLLLLCFHSFSVEGNSLAPDIPDGGIVESHFDTFLNPKKDYGSFPARITDRDQYGRIVKMKSETGNVRFLKVGDRLTFKVSRQIHQPCVGHIRDVEKNYLVVFVQDLSVCWPESEILRRGALVKVDSDDLHLRVQDASNFRKVLMGQKEDFGLQLDRINKFLWSFDQQKVKVATKYDDQIVELQKRRQLALDGLILKKQESLILQRELMQKLDQIKRDLTFYKVERDELITDRWHTSRGKGLPTQERPQKILPYTNSKKRWHNPAFK